MKIVAISDLHGHLPEIPECDLLIIAGDVCPDFWVRGPSYELIPDMFLQQEWLQNTFKRWLERVPATQTVGIAGNHDFVFEQGRDRKPPDKGLTRPDLPWDYLRDNSIVVNGLKIWGTPWVPRLLNWAFYANDPALAARMEMIPDDVDILISHGPPFGYRDTVRNESVGEHALNLDLNRIRPRLVFCGHIHEQHGHESHPSGAEIYNVSLLDDNYDPVYPVTEIDIDA